MRVAEQFRVDEVGPTYWRVTFDNGPVNLDVATLPDDDEFAPGLKEYFATAGRAENRPFVQLLLRHGLQQPDGIETDLGAEIAQLRQTS